MNESAFFYRAHDALRRETPQPEKLHTDGLLRQRPVDLNSCFR